MLAKLTIKNVALIESAEICFSEGLNVLSGETGAGKSVILDSVNFVLGAKADKTMIRYGETECFVRAEFILPKDCLAVKILQEMDIETESEIIISRKFSDAGKNSIKINGSTVTAAMLRKVTDSLVDVHGQSEHFFLLKEANQLKTLDEVVGGELTEKKKDLALLLAERKSIDGQISKLGGDEQQRSRRLDVLRYQIDEIEQAAWKEGEEEELVQRRNKINNVEKIISALKEAVGAFSADGGVLDGMRMAKRAMGTVSRIGEEYEKIEERIETLASEANDLSETLSEMGEELYFDENEAEEIEARIDVIRSLQKKYGANKDLVDYYLQRIKEEYDLLSDCEGQYNKLTLRRGKLNGQIYKICREMSSLRKTYGEGFCTRVTEELKTLNIASAKFSIDFAKYGEEDVERVTENGLDSVCFLFSANAGEPEKPLGKIISGGEMSRFMLAVKTQLSSVNEISSYIFDEIDAGISGKTAKVVGEKFAKIAKTTQIIAVSHLAQIAAMSDRQFLIEKQEEEGKTLTRVKQLSDAERTGELVRLLGGGDSDEFAKKHAEELIKQAKEYKAL